MNRDLFMEVSFCFCANRGFLLVLKGAEKFTLPIGLNTLLTPYGNNYDVLIAGSMFGILPIFEIFLIFQKYIIDGMTAGAVKG